MKGRRDIDEYRSSCQNMENWVPTAQGAMIRRPGSNYGGPADNKLDPPPVPPDPPGAILPPDKVVTNGEFHGYSVRRRLNNSYEGPLILVGRDPSVSGNDDLIPIFSELLPDADGVFWIDEGQILQAFIDTGQDPVAGEARLAIYTIYDQVTNEDVVPRNLISSGSSVCPFAFTGAFGSFAYVDAPGSETSPRVARCQMGTAIPWRSGGTTVVGAGTPSSDRWFPTVGDYANGGIVSVGAIDGTFDRGESGIDNTRRNVMAINFGNGTPNPLISLNEQNGDLGPGNTAWGDKFNQPPGDISQIGGSGAPFTSFSTPDEFNVVTAACKTNVVGGQTAFAYSVARSRTEDQQVVAFGSTTADRAFIDTEDLRGLSADAAGNLNRDRGYWNFTEWWFLVGDTGDWGGNAVVDNPERGAELAKTVKLNPENVIPIP